jgi:metal-responsive CopG/Arc/MetJ family transcriptional regulator
VVKKISLSLPEELLHELDDLAKESGRTRSSIVTEMLKTYFSKPRSYREPKVYPTALQKLKEQSVIRLRSPKLAKVRIRDDWIIESEV